MALGEKLLLYDIQSTFPPNERLARDLNVFLDAGLLRCRGRLEHSDLKWESKYPIYLPKEARLSLLIIKELHDNAHNCGINNLLAMLRQRYWVPQGRRTVKNAIFSKETRFLHCIRYKLDAYKLPSEPPLPHQRVLQFRPFLHIGVDYFGPIRVQGVNEEEKVWVAIFTCMSCRAIHMEVVPDCSTSSFLTCFRRFVARRGLPKLINSDNGKQFVLGSKVILSVWSDLLKNHIVHQLTERQGIEWRFNTEKAPWKGGHFERLIGLVKHCLR